MRVAGWQQLSRRERVLIILLGVMVAGATTWWLALEPAVTRIQQLRRDLAAAEAVLAGHPTAQAALDAYRARLAELQRADAASARQIPRDLESTAVAVFVEQVARRSGLRLLAIDLGAGADAPDEVGNQDKGGPKGTQQGERFQSWPVKLEIAGSYDQVRNFVRILEGWERLWRLAQVEIVPEAAEPGKRDVPADGQGPGTAVLRAAAPGAPGPETSHIRVTLSILLFTDTQAASLEDQHLAQLGVTPQEKGNTPP